MFVQGGILKPPAERVVDDWLRVLLIGIPS